MCVYTCVGVCEACKEWWRRWSAFQTSDGSKQSKASVRKLCNLRLPNGNNGHSRYRNPSRQPMYTSVSSEILEDSSTSGSGLTSLNTRHLQPKWNHGGWFPSYVVSNDADLSRKAFKMVLVLFMVHKSFM